MYCESFNPPYIHLERSWVMFRFYLANLLLNIKSKVTASELDVHRLAQFELSGTLHGSKQVVIITDFFVKYFVLNTYRYVGFHPSSIGTYGTLLRAGVVVPTILTDRIWI